MKSELCTPPASSPESASKSPVQPHFNHNNLKHIPDALGIFEYSSPQTPALLCPDTPPITNHWGPQTESSLPLNPLSLDSQLTPWPSQGYSNVAAAVTSSISWETPGVYASSFPNRVPHHGTSASTYSPYPAEMCHGLPLQHSTAYSPYDASEYGIDNGSTQSSQYISGNPFQMQSNPYSDPYSAPFNPDFTLPYVQADADQFSENTVPVVMSTVPTHNCVQTQSLPNSSPPEVPSSPESLDPMAHVARVRTRRRSALKPSTPLFPCPVCKRLFDRTYNRTEHMKTHNKNRERPFRCPVKGCRQPPFSRVHDRDRHFSTVSSDSLIDFLY
jgi:hypothetical protein